MTYRIIENPTRHTAYMREYLKNPEKRALHRQRGREVCVKARRDVFAHYGNQCACCGESNIEFLTIDHPEGGGNAHRKAIKRMGSSFYMWLRREGFPPGFRTLCLNCNSATSRLAVCPHQRFDLRSNCINL